MFQITIGRIKLSASMENDGDISQTYFVGNNDTDDEWKSVIVSLCSPGVNFTNILRAAFFTKLLCIAFLFLLFGFGESTQVQICAPKMLMKLTTGVNFTNIWRAAFFMKLLCTTFLLLLFGFGESTKVQIYARKMLMKLTTGVNFTNFLRAAFLK